MALSEEDRRRIEEEEFRRVARERALQSAEPPSPPVLSGLPENTNKESANLQTGLGAGLVGSGVAGLFVFPPIGITVLALGVTNLIWANERKKRSK